MTSTKKSRKIRKKSQKESSLNSDMNEQNSSKINRTISKKEDIVDSGSNSMITTKNFCRLQIQRQIDLNQKENMDDMYLNCLTEDEFDEKIRWVIKNLIEDSRITPSQVTKVIKVISYIKENGWFERFEYKNYKCAIELDSSGKWRIYVQPHKDDVLPFMVDTRDDYSYCDNSSRFSLPDYPLGLWWYGDKIGLDDFLGVSVLNQYSWREHFEEKKRKRISRNRFWYLETDRIVGKYEMKIRCKNLVDALISYQDQRKVISEYNELMSKIRTIEGIAVSLYNQQKIKSIQKLSLELKPIINVRKKKRGELV